MYIENNDFCGKPCLSFLTTDNFWNNSLFYEHSVFLVSASVCLCCAYNMLKMIKSVVKVMTYSVRSANLHVHSANSEIAIQWCSLKYNHELRSHPNVKLHMTRSLFVSAIGPFIIIRFNTKFYKNCGILKSSTAKAGLNVISYFLFLVWRYA